MNKQINIWKGNDVPPTNNHLWVKEDGTIWVYLDEWVNIINLIISNKDLENIHSLDEIIKKVQSNTEYLTELKKRDEFDLVTYGVRWNVNQTGLELERVGNLTFHKTLPIQSKFKPCVTDRGTVLYYLNPNNFNLKETSYTINNVDNNYQNSTSNVYIDDSDEAPKVGDTLHCVNYITKTLTVNSINKTGDWLLMFCSCSGAPNNNDVYAKKSKLDGTDGMVRIETPSFYGKSFIDGDDREVRITEQYIDDSWVYIPSLVIDLFHATSVSSCAPSLTYLSNLAASGPVAISISLGANSSYLSQQSSPSKDTIERTGSHLLTYDLFKWVFYWLYVIEYANFNSSIPFDESLTSEGFKKGGLGEGIQKYYENLNTDTAEGAYKESFANTAGCMDTIRWYSNVSYSFPCWRGFFNIQGDKPNELDFEADRDGNFTILQDGTYLSLNNIEGGSVKVNVKEYVLNETGEILPLYTMPTSESNFKKIGGYYTLETSSIGGKLRMYFSSGFGCNDTLETALNVIRIVDNLETNSICRTYNVKDE